MQGIASSVRWCCLLRGMQGVAHACARRIAAAGLLDAAAGCLLLSTAAARDAAGWMLLPAGWMLLAVIQD
jgi:hypothetical protein